MNKIFPSEFSDLLNRNGLKILNQTAISDEASKLCILTNIIKAPYTMRIIRVLNSFLYPVLNNFSSPIPNDLKKTKKNFCEKMGKSMQVKSTMINRRGSVAYEIACDLGMTDMLQSESFKRMGEISLNRNFGTLNSKQITCYENGGYVGPHADYFPEFPKLKNGYFDIQLMFSNDWVQQQWLVYEENGYLNKIVDVSCRSGIAIYHLPFWHYTTPLVPKTEKNNLARRLLIATSFLEL